MRIIDESDDSAALDSEDENRYISQVKTALGETVIADKKLAREKLTEMRLKKKR